MNDGPEHCLRNGAGSRTQGHDMIHMADGVGTYACTLIVNINENLLVAAHFFVQNQTCLPICRHGVPAWRQ